MASVTQEIITSARPEGVWDAIRDVGALHTRLVVGFVVDTRLEPGARVVTFKNGMVVKEPIVTVDDQARRLVWSAEAPSLAHYNASVQVFDVDGRRTRVVWIADFLPDEAHTFVAGMIGEGLAAMKATLDAQSAGWPPSHSSWSSKDRGAPAGLTDMRTDRALVARLLERDDAAFAEFFDLMFPRVYRFALARVGHQRGRRGGNRAGHAVPGGTAASDLARRSEPVHLDLYDLPARDRRRGGARIPARRPCRSSKTCRRSAPPWNPWYVQELCGTDAGVQRQELAALVQRVLDHLPVHYGNVLEWKYLEEVPVADIAARLDVSTKAAESLLTRARAAFRDLVASLAPELDPGRTAGLREHCHERACSHLDLTRRRFETCSCWPAAGLPRRRSGRLAFVPPSKPSGADRPAGGSVGRSGRWRRRADWRCCSCGRALRGRRRQRRRAAQPLATFARVNGAVQVGVAGSAGGSRLRGSAGGTRGQPSRRPRDAPCSHSRPATPCGWIATPGSCWRRQAGCALERGRIYVDSGEGTPAGEGLQIATSVRRRPRNRYAIRSRRRGRDRAGSRARWCGADRQRARSIDVAAAEAVRIRCRRHDRAAGRFCRPVPSGHGSTRSRRRSRSKAPGWTRS